MRMRFVRDNDDPTLLADLDRLAGREPVAPVVPEPLTDDEGVADESGEVAEPTPLDDPFVRGFVQASVHLKRYAPFYAGAAAWAATMLLIQPLGGDDPGTTPAAFAGAVSGASSASEVAAVAPSSDLNADAIGAPTFEAITGATFAPSSSFDSTSEFAADDSSSSSSTFDDDSSFGSSAGDDTPTFDFSDDFGSEVEEGLTIVRSGYASATGGTPADEDPPGGGLPVAVTLGNDTKRSFLALSGSGTELRLRQAPDGALQPEAAVIKACPLTSDWEAERGQSIADSPTFDSACSTGFLSDGVWTFDLSGFTPEDLAKGLTLTPGPGTGHTFEVVLEPNPVPSDSSSES